MAASGIGFFYCRIHHLFHHGRDVRPDPVALNVGHDRVIRHHKTPVRINGYGTALRRNLNMLKCAHMGYSP